MSNNSLNFTDFLPPVISAEWLNPVNTAVSNYCGIASGTGNAIALASPAYFSAFSPGQPLTFVASSTNAAGAITLSVTTALGNTLVANLIGANGGSLAAGAITAGLFYQIVYNGINFQLSLGSPIADTISSLAAIPGGAIGNGSVINVSDYSTPGDQGGGQFQWNSTSTLQPDIGATICPLTFQTPVVGEAHGTGTGSAATIVSNALTSSMTFIIGTASTAGVAVGQYVSPGTPGIAIGETVASVVANTSVTLALGNLGDIASGTTFAFFTPTTFTLAHANSIPQSISISAGLAANLVDDGAGTLLVNGVPLGTVNYVTGAVVINTLIAAGQAITASYSYASAAGRWLRVIIGDVIYPTWFGANNKNGADATAAIQAANNYAYANNCTLDMSGQYITSYTVNLTSGYSTSRGTAGNDGQFSGSAVIFNPFAAYPDLYPAFICTGRVVESIHVETGNTVYTGGSLSQLINYTRFGDLSVYSTTPQYSAIAPGPVGFSMGRTAAQPIFRNCGSARIKFGLLLDNTAGHTTSENCIWYGLAGVFCYWNYESYIFQGGGASGNLCGVMFGDLYAPNGLPGGLSGQTTFQNIDFGFSPYCFFQVHNNLTPVASPGGLSDDVCLNCGFEDVGEAAFRLLPGAPFGMAFENCGPPGYSGTHYNGVGWLPSQFPMTNGHTQFWIWAGNLTGSFKWNGYGNGSWGDSSGYVAGTLTGVMICQGIVNNDYSGPAGQPLRPQDWAFFGEGGLVFVNSSGVALTSNYQASVQYPNFLDNQSQLPVATKNVLQIQHDFLQDGNFLLNPEVAGNWSVNGGSTVVTGAYSSFGGLPATTAIPQAMKNELGTNPNVAHFNTGTNTLVIGQLAMAAGTLTLPASENIGYSFWIYIPVYAYGCQSKLTNGAVDILQASSAPPGKWCKAFAYGQNMQQNEGYGSNTYTSFVFVSLGATNQDLYIAGLMCFSGEVKSYNPKPSPTSFNNIGVGTVGKGFQVAEGANAKQGVATLSAGTVTVANTSVTANSRIFLTIQSLGTVSTPTAVAVTARTPGTSFTIASSTNTDTSVVAWEIFEPG